MKNRFLALSLDSNLQPSGNSRFDCLDAVSLSNTQNQKYFPSDFSGLRLIRNAPKSHSEGAQKRAQFVGNCSCSSRVSSYCFSLQARCSLMDSRTQERATVTYTPEVEKVMAEINAIEQERRVAIKRRSETTDDMEKSILDEEIARLREKLSAARRKLTNKP